MIDRLISLLFFAGLGLLAFVLLILVAAAAWWAYQHLPRLDFWNRSFSGTRSRPQRYQRPDHPSRPTSSDFSFDIPSSLGRDRFTARQIAALIEEDRRTQFRFTIVIVVSACLLLVLLFFLMP